MSEPKPKISVVMPAFNAERYIDESIKSILDQTFQEFELIIIDDGSTDKTEQIIEEYAKRDGRIIVIKNKKNLGVAKCRNIGIDRAQGKYIAWQDADDLSMPIRLKEQYNYLESHLEVGIVGGYLNFISDDNKNLFVRKYPEADASLRKTIFLYSPVSQGVSMVRREILLKVGKYNDELTQAEDLDISFRIGTIAKFANVQKILLNCRFHEKSLSTNKMKENISCTLAVRKKALSYGYKMNIKDRASFVMAWIIKFSPPKFIFWVFNLLRNNR